MGDKTAEGTFSAKASPTTRCIVSFGSAIFQYPAFEAIEGYDPGSKMWKWSAFNAAGEHWVTYCSADAEALKGSRPTYKYETTVAKPDGKKDVWRGKLTITFGKDEFRSVFSENTLNGEKQPDEQYVYTRKK
jgi:hypothetical protein